jgi:anaerobic ribonucleoside-triphosphate reductase
VDYKLLTPLENLPLSRAVLCVDCETVFRVERKDCPSCGSKSFVVLARAVGYLEAVRRGEEKS